MKRATKREKRKRRKQRKQAVERLIQNTERRLVSKVPEETWQWTAGQDRTVTLPPLTPGRKITIKTSGPTLPPGTKITVQPGSTVRMSSLVSGQEPMNEEQLMKWLSAAFGKKP